MQTLMALNPVEIIKLTRIFTCYLLLATKTNQTNSFHTHLLGSFNVSDSFDETEIIRIEIELNRK
jgi:hypothetical protein